MIKDARHLTLGFKLFVKHSKNTTLNDAFAAFSDLPSETEMRSKMDTF
jgi:hypothetical protein